MSTEQKLAEAVQPFVLASNSGEFETITARTRDIAKAREALAAYDSQPRTVLEPLTEQEAAEAAFDYYRHWPERQRADVADAHFDKDLAMIRLAERAFASKNGKQLADRGQG